MIDLSNDRRSVEIQIQGYIRKGQIVPFRVLQHYAHILTADGTLTPSGSTGGSGGNTPSSASAADVKSGIDTSNDVDTIIAELEKITTLSHPVSIRSQVIAALSDTNNEIEEVKTALGSKTDTPTANPSVSGSLIGVIKGLWDFLTTKLNQLEATFAGTDATRIESAYKVVSTAGGTQVVNADSNRTELVIQNKSELDFLYISRGSAGSPTASFTVPPLGFLSFQSLKAQQQYIASNYNTENRDIGFYIEQTLLPSSGGTSI